MATKPEVLNLTLRQDHNEKTWWRPCGVAFLHRNEDSSIKSITVKLDLFPNLDLVAFPKRAEEGSPAS